MAKSKFPCGHDGGKPIDNKDVIILGASNAYCTSCKKEFEWMPAHWREKIPRVEKELSKNPVQSGESGQTAEMEATLPKKKLGIFGH